MIHYGSIYWIDKINLKYCKGNFKGDYLQELPSSLSLALQLKSSLSVIWQNSYPIYPRPLHDVFIGDDFFSPHEIKKPMNCSFHS